jgi:predicted unusual protein kinase regulating ubiquinone biosynthesis (AarF/ABC1/UbiB family)
MTADPGQFGRRHSRPPEQTASTPDLAEVLAPGVGHDLPPVRMDIWRYLRVAWFFARMFLSTIWWDLVLRHVPGLSGIAQRNSLARWQAWAKRFRRLAVSQGGVLIKLGQFLSTRVDVLPPAVTDELKGLQDEVPSESLADIRALIAAEFGRPVEQVFSCFEPVPEAAASLAQVHRACLMDGTKVVVKVQRPRIERLVATDLAAMRLAIRWLKWYRPIARRVDLDQLYAEFSATTRAELDFIAEGHNADRFAANFADDPGVYIADVFWEYTTRRVLTLENVASIKINDFAGIDAAGISRPQLARKLYDTYLEQIFVHHFLHADPHPGNLFVHPLPRDPAATAGSPTPFLLIFVDFGMVAVIPERLRSGLRDYVIAVGTRDAHLMVKAYQEAGVLLPGADVKRLEALHALLFSQLGGVPIGKLSDAAMEQAQLVLHEYRDIIYEMPFQFPTDMLFTMRAVAILSGMATSLDPDFDPWAATLPFAQRMAGDEGLWDWRKWLGEAAELGRLAVRLPARMDRFLEQAERGELVVQYSLAPDAAKAARRIERSVDRLTWGVLSAGLLVAGVVLRASEGASTLSTGLLIAAGAAFVWGLTRR